MAEDRRANNAEPLSTATGPPFTSLPLCGSVAPRRRTGD